MQLVATCSLLILEECNAISSYMFSTILEGYNTFMVSERSSLILCVSCILHTAYFRLASVSAHGVIKCGIWLFFL